MHRKWRWIGCFIKMRETSIKYQVVRLDESAKRKDAQFSGSSRIWLLGICHPEPAIKGFVIPKKQSQDEHD